MTAELLAFPRHRNLPFVRRHAEHLRGCSTRRGAERYLQLQLRIQAETMERRGLSPDIIEVEIENLHAAIQRELHRGRVLPGGVA